MDVQEELMNIWKMVDDNMPVSKEKASKVKIPEPKSFSGARSSKELESFLWHIEDIEQYFCSAWIPDVEKVTILACILLEMKSYGW